jgi:F420-0:gamma-glutamyl ligase-like protein
MEKIRYSYIFHIGNTVFLISENDQEFDLLYINWLKYVLKRIIGPISKIKKKIRQKRRIKRKKNIPILKF